MGLGVVVIFALLWIGLCAGEKSSSSVSTEDLSNRKSTDASNHHHRLAREKTSAVKDEDEIFDSNIYLELVTSKTPPEDAVKVSHLNQNWYILVTGKCDKLKLDLLKVESQGANNDGRQFLVNKDDFEILEWKTWADVQNGQIQFYPLRICKSHYIAKNQNGITFMAMDSFKKQKNMQTEVLTVDSDINWEHLQIDNYVVTKKKTDENSEVIKQFTVLNENCESAKHVVKLDQGSDKTSSFLTGRTNTLGWALEGSVSGKIPELFSLGGKFGFKHDYGRSKSITTSKVDKVLHSVSMEVQVPPRHSCTIEITSTTFMLQVPYTGWLMRQYKKTFRMTSVTGLYNYQEETEVQTSVKPCTSLKDGHKCAYV